MWKDDTPLDGAIRMGVGGGEKERWCDSEVYL